MDFELLDEPALDFGQGTDPTDGPTAEAIGPDVNQADIVNGSATVDGTVTAGSASTSDAVRSRDAGIAYPDAQIGSPDYTDLTEIGIGNFTKIGAGVLAGVASLAHNALGGNSSSTAARKVGVNRPQSTGAAPRGVMGMLMVPDGHGGYKLGPMGYVAIAAVAGGAFLLWRR